MALSVTKLKHWKGILGILVAISTPVGAWLSNECSLRAAIGMGIIGGLASAYNWTDQSLKDAMNEPPKG